MRNLVASTIVALGIVAGLSAAASAEPFNPTTFFEEIDKSAA